jgi:hypothetical protein
VKSRYDDLTPTMQDAVTFVLGLMKDTKDWDTTTSYTSVVYTTAKHKKHDVTLTSASSVYEHLSCSLEKEDIPVAAKDMRDFWSRREKQESDERAAAKDKRVGRILKEINDEQT